MGTVNRSEVVRQVQPTADDPQFYGECWSENYMADRTIEIWLPETFYGDHRDRALPAGQILESSRKGVLVFCNKAELSEIMSDAKHYSEMGTAAFGMESLGLVSSARATVNRIRKMRKAQAAASQEEVAFKTVRQG